MGVHLLTGTTICIALLREHGHFATASEQRWRAVCSGSQVMTGMAAGSGFLDWGFRVLLDVAPCLLFYYRA